MAVSLVRAVSSGGAVSRGTERFTQLIREKNVLVPGDSEIPEGARLAASSLTVPAAIDARIAAQESPEPIPAFLIQEEIHLERAELYRLRVQAEMELAACGLDRYLVAIVELGDGKAEVTMLPCVPASEVSRSVPARTSARDPRQAIAAVNAPLSAGTQGALALPSVRRA